MNRCIILCLTIFAPIITLLPSGCSEAPDLTEELGNLKAPLLKAPPNVRIPGEYVVVFADNASASAIEAAADQVAHANHRDRILYQYSVIPGFAARLDDAALDALRHDPHVAYIEENQQIWLSTAYPNPPDGIDRTDQRLGHDNMYQDHDRTGAGVHVYVLDTGINTQHAEFTGRIGNGYTAIADGQGIEDCHGHGSHVSSTAAGTNYGMAKQASIHPVRILDCTGSGSWAGVIAGVDFVRNDCSNQNGPCVANLSLGGEFYAPMNQAVANAVDSGVTFVVAAGNEDQDACNRSPASEPKAITVAAIDDFDSRATFSNWGSCVDIFAPGVSILGASIGSNWATATMSGTSMASPHVAGAVAQYLGSNPAATPIQVEANIEGAGSIDCVDDPQGSPNLLLFNDLSQGNYYCSNDPASGVLVTGVWHTCALDSAGAVRCWGYNYDGQLGYGHTNHIGDNELPSTAGPVDVGGTVLQLAAGRSHTCALLDTGAVRCWGLNGYGQLGYGHMNNIGDDELPSSAGDVSVGGNVVQIAAGEHHTCALLDTGAVRCWGLNYQGQLGYGHTNYIGDNELPSSAGDVGLGGTAVGITAGGTHTCALLDTGGVRCWGNNSLGQLGYGHTNYIGDNELPSSAGDISLGGRAVQVGGGGLHTCALLDTGAVRCWGHNYHGQLGYGHTQKIGDNELPSSVGPVSLGDTATLIISSYLHNCVLLSSGGLRCWGDNGFGQLGYGNEERIGDNELPSSVGNVSVGGTVEQLALGMGTHTCVLLTTGGVRCWGQNHLGQLGYGHIQDIGDNELPSSAGDVPYE